MASTVLPPSPHQPCAVEMQFSDGQGRVEVCGGGVGAWVHCSAEWLAEHFPRVHVHPDYHEHKGASDVAVQA